MARSHGTRYHYQTGWGSDIPPDYLGTGAPLHVQNYFSVDVDGWIVGVRYFRNLEDDGVHIGLITQEADNHTLGVVKFKDREAEAAGDDGWQHAYFSPRIPIENGVLYNVGVIFEKGGMYADLDGFDASATVVSEDITYGPDSALHWNGQFTAQLGTSNYTHADGVRYGVDILFLSEALP